MGGEGGDGGCSRVDVRQASDSDDERRQGIRYDDGMVVCRQEQNCIRCGAEGDDFVLVFIEVRVVIYEEDGILEGKEVRQGHRAEIGNIDGEEDLEERHGVKKRTTIKMLACEKLVIFIAQAAATRNRASRSDVLHLSHCKEAGIPT